MSNHKLKIGITQGDTNGIGYEVILKMLEGNLMTELCTPIIYGSARAAAQYRKMMDLQPVPMTQIESAAEAREGAVSVINVVGEDLKIEPGVASPEAGKAAFAALERAVADLHEGLIDAIVTAPINKHSIQSETFMFPGHTEYLQASCGGEALMVLCTDRLRVALVTTHMPLAKVPQTITRELIEQRLEAFNSSLQRDFGVPTPRIAVLALNPHAGEEGMLGTEEAEIITPAIEAAREKKIMAFGPYAADGFFGSDAPSHFDGVLAMYHDQGLAPFKALNMATGVNFTAGLPYVRTSPDHGTGYDIAGQGRADEQSMRSAVYMAIDVVRNRQRHEEAHRRPLRKQYFEKGSDNVKLNLTATDAD